MLEPLLVKSLTHDTNINIQLIWYTENTRVTVPNWQYNTNSIILTLQNIKYPIASNTIPHCHSLRPHHAALMWNPVICTFFYNPSFSAANILLLSLTSLLISSSSCPVFILVFDYSGGAWSRCKRNQVKKGAVSYYEGRMSHLSSSPFIPPPGTPTNPNSAPGPLHSALQVFESVITVGDLHSCLSQGCEASSKGHWG